MTDGEAGALAMIERAIAAQRSGHAEAAARHYRAALDRAPRHPVANHNLGSLLAQGGDAEAALPLLRTALDAAPQQGQYWLSYARGLLAAGHADDALRVLEQGARGGLAGAAFDQLAARARSASAGSAHAGPPIDALRTAVAHAPDDAPLHVEYGDALAGGGDLDGAVAAYRHAVALAPDATEAHFRLGSILSEAGEVAEGFAHFMQRAALIHAALADDPAAPAHRRKHDREQREYLDSRGICDTFRIACGDRVEGRAVDTSRATPALIDRWHSAAPKLVVIDDFLTAPALARLREYCAGSTIWRRNYAAGYIGATPEDGFACPLLAQIAEEISTTFPEIFAPHRFRYLGAFKYDSMLSTGTNIHADNSAVNVNFYITPDEANRDPASGGMKIWDVAAPDAATMRRLNGDDAAMREFLERSGARAMIVPHRANRAIFFKSTLFHKTDDCAFTEGYLNKRINVSLLYGEPAFDGEAKSRR